MASKSRMKKLQAWHDELARHIGHRMECERRYDGGVPEVRVLERLFIDWEIWGVKLWFQSDNIFPHVRWDDQIGRCLTCKDSA